jgi:hypothetical protein
MNKTQEGLTTTIMPCVQSAEYDDVGMKRKGGIYNLYILGVGVERERGRRGFSDYLECLID